MSRSQTKQIFIRVTEKEKTAFEKACKGNKKTKVLMIFIRLFIRGKIPLDELEYRLAKAMAD